MFEDEEVHLKQNKPYITKHPCKIFPQFIFKKRKQKQSKKLEINSNIEFQNEYYLGQMKFNAIKCLYIYVNK